MTASMLTYMRGSLAWGEERPCEHHLCVPGQEGRGVATEGAVLQQSIQAGATPQWYTAVTPYQGTHFVQCVAQWVTYFSAQVHSQAMCVCIMQSMLEGDSPHSSCVRLSPQTGQKPKPTIRSGPAVELLALVASMLAAAALCG